MHHDNDANDLQWLMEVMEMIGCVTYWPKLTVGCVGVIPLIYCMIIALCFRKLNLLISRISLPD